jgi:hypothetical protein
MIYSHLHACAHKYTRACVHKRTQIYWHVHVLGIFTGKRTMRFIQRAMHSCMQYKPLLQLPWNARDTRETVMLLYCCKAGSPRGRNGTYHWEQIYQHVEDLQRHAPLAVFSFLHTLCHDIKHTKSVAESKPHVASRRWCASLDSAVTVTVTAWSKWTNVSCWQTRSGRGANVRLQYWPSYLDRKTGRLTVMQVKMLSFSQSTDIDTNNTTRFFVPQVFFKKMLWAVDCCAWQGPYDATMKSLAQHKHAFRCGHIAKFVLMSTSVEQVLHARQKNSTAWDAG